MAQQMNNDEDMKGLGKYICPVNQCYSDMCNRVSALFLNQEIEEFDINDDELEAAQCKDSNPEIYSISRIVGELFEDLEMSVDSVDQMMALYLALTPDKIDNIRNMTLNPVKRQS